MAKQDIATAERRATCLNRLADSYTCLTGKDYASDKEKEGAQKRAAAARIEAKKPLSPASSGAQTVANSL